jgi:hypothetical protein
MSNVYLLLLEGRGGRCLQGLSRPAGNCGLPRNVKHHNIWLFTAHIVLILGNASLPSESQSPHRAAKSDPWPNILA